jgi:hypothetical protein
MVEGGRSFVGSSDSGLGGNGGFHALELALSMLPTRSKLSAATSRRSELGTKIIKAVSSTVLISIYHDYRLIASIFFFATSFFLLQIEYQDG